MNSLTREWQRKTDNVKRVTLPSGENRKALPEHITDFVEVEAKTWKEFNLDKLNEPFARHDLFIKKKRSLYTDKLPDNGRGR